MGAAAAYFRVSSRQQDLATQRRAVLMAAEARGDLVHPIHQFEEKLSARKLERPELSKIRAGARLGEISRLYVFRIDRLCRSGIRDTLKVLDELRSHGCRVISVADGFDLDGPAAEVVISVMAWAAQLERLALGERISAARERVEAAGGNWGRRRKIDPMTLAAARKMVDKDGLSIRVVSARLRLSKATLARALRGEGHYREKTATTESQELNDSTEQNG